MINCLILIDVLFFYFNEIKGISDEKLKNFKHEKSYYLKFLKINGLNLKILGGYCSKNKFIDEFSTCLDSDANKKMKEYIKLNFDIIFDFLTNESL